MQEIVLNRDGFEAPQKRLTAREFVLDGMRDAMLDGRLTAGQELDDQVLAKAFGVSRTPVREALKVLEVQGFVKHKPFSKPVVASASSGHLEEVYVMRIALEGLAVGRACHALDADAYAGLESCALSARQALAQKDRLAWSRWNREFHLRLATASGMPLLSREIGSLIDLSSFYSRMNFEQIPEAFAEAQGEHLEILDACRKGDSDLATRLLQEHLRASYTAQVKLVRQREEME